MIKNIKNTVPWTYLVNDLNGEEIVRTFYEKELQQSKQTIIWVEKVIKKKKRNCMLNRKVTIIHLIAGLIKMRLYKNESIFSKTI